MAQFAAYKGVARYTANFTPPTSPQIDRDYSQSLLVNAYPVIYDTARQRLVETVGNISTGIATANQIGGDIRNALYFDGTGDYLDIGTSNEPDFDFGIGDFTIETWTFLASSGDKAICSYVAHDATVQASNVCWGFDFYNTPNSNVRFFLYNGTTIYQVSDPATVSLNVWAHIAIVRESGTLKLFVNGSQVATTSANVNINTPAGRYLSVGRYFGTRNFHGGMHDLRITKGVARYTTNFTPPKGHLPVK
jgi:hypothetical protein